MPSRRRAGGATTSTRPSTSKRCATGRFEMALRPIPRPKVPRVGRPLGKFTQHRRLDFLREKLEAHAAGLTLEDLAGMLRMTTRSVRRYLHELSLVTEVESLETSPGGPHLWRIKPSERGRTVA